MKEAAMAANLPVHQPPRFAPEVEEQLRALAPDVVIIAYGRLHSPAVKHSQAWVDQPSRFLLPKYRGLLR
jgi:methionyl-tRNA formyltransferase